MKKKYYLVQIGVSYSSPCFFPYGAGCIAAFLKKDREITDFYEIPDIIALREPIDKIVTRFSDPDYVALSAFVWNFEYCKQLAQKLKKLFPNVKIIFGGHNAGTDGALLKQYPYIDFLMHNEGEESTAVFLKAQKDGTPLENVPNLSFRKNDEIITTHPYIPQDLSSYPSPYLEGIFDNLLKEFPDTEFHATLETNRGCPYSCAYCEWCFSHKIRLFPMEKIKAEIEWIASNKIKYTYCADANFGILSRDVEIARYVIEQKKKYGYPHVFKPCYAKESDDNVFEAGYLLNKNTTDKGVTLSYQTLSPEALQNIGRKNLTLKRFEELELRYKNAGIPTYSELILGLPGETFESFCQGICSILEHGQHNSMLVYECQIHPNSPMAQKDYREKHGIKTSRIPLFGIHYNPQFNGVQEYFDIVTETNTMSKTDWVKSYMFSVVLQAFHHFALLRFFSIYANRKLKVSFFEFYTKLFDYIFNESKGFIHKLFSDLYRRKEDTKTANWTYQKDIFGSVGWYFEEGAFLELVKSGDLFWEEILPFLKQFHIEETLFDELFLYQKSLIRTLGTTEVDLTLHWNFYSYFEDQSGKTPLIPMRSHLQIKSDLTLNSWEEYAKEVIWFGKRHGLSLFTNIKDKATYTEEHTKV